MTDAKINKKAFLKYFIGHEVYQLKQEKPHLQEEATFQEPEEGDKEPADQEVSEPVKVETEEEAPYSQGKEAESGEEDDRQDTSGKEADQMKWAVILEDPYAGNGEISPKFELIIENILGNVGFDKESFEFLRDDESSMDFPEKDGQGTKLNYLLFTQKEVPALPDHVFKSDLLEEVAKSKKAKRALWYHLKKFEQYVVQTQ